MAGGWIGLAQVAVPRSLAFAALGAASVSVAAAAGARSATPATVPGGRGTRDFLVFAGVVIGVATAALISGTAVLVSLAALLVLIARGRMGGLHVPGADAALAGLPFMYGALAVGQAPAGVVPWILAAALALVREVTTAAIAEPRSGSPRSGARGTAVASALAFIPLSLILPARVGYGAGYFLIALFAQLSVLVAATRLIVARVERVDLLLKGAMVVGLIALIVGRVA